jgi:hypothetical protein
MTKFAKSITLAALTATVVGMSLLTSPIAAQAEPLGSTCSDCAAYRGEYTVENHTGMPLMYFFRWGDNESWRPVILGNDTIRTHTYPLGDNPQAAVPTPSVRIKGHWCGDGSAECSDGNHWRTYSMDFYAVRVDPGFTSPGTVIKRGTPMPFEIVSSPGNFGGVKLRIVRDN